jgi:hypothetical protein
VEANQPINVRTVEAIASQWKKPRHACAELHVDEVDVEIVDREDQHVGCDHGPDIDIAAQPMPAAAIEHHAVPAARDKGCDAGKRMQPAQKADIFEMHVGSILLLSLLARRPVFRSRR